MKDVIDLHLICCLSNDSFSTEVDKAIARIHERGFLVDVEEMDSHNKRCVLSAYRDVNSNIKTHSITSSRFRKLRDQK